MFIQIIRNFNPIGRRNLLNSLTFAPTALSGEKYLSKNFHSIGRATMALVLFRNIVPIRNYPRNDEKKKDVGDIII